MRKPNLQHNIIFCFFQLIQYINLLITFLAIFSIVKLLYTIKNHPKISGGFKQIYSSNLS